MGENEVIRMAFDILGALQYMHTQKVVHQDIKPTNIMVSNSEQRASYKLIDFSSAAAMASWWL